MTVEGVTLEAFWDILQVAGLGYCHLIELENHHRLTGMAILASDIPPDDAVLGAESSENCGVEGVEVNLRRCCIGFYCFHHNRLNSFGLWGCIDLWDFLYNRFHLFRLWSWGDCFYLLHLRLKGLDGWTVGGHPALVCGKDGVCCDSCDTCDRDNFSGGGQGGLN
jgi:hypothetical protein